MTRKVWDAEMVARAAGLKRAGFTTKAIAERLGVTAKAVANRMYRAGARVRLDGKSGSHFGRSNFHNGPLTVDIKSKGERVSEYLEEGEDE
jgi:hypothetical protein